MIDPTTLTVILICLGLMIVLGMASGGESDLERARRSDHELVDAKYDRLSKGE